VCEGADDAVAQYVTTSECVYDAVGQLVMVTVCEGADDAVGQ
jgi:hypothetical protein